MHETLWGRDVEDVDSQSSLRQSFSLPLRQDRISTKTAKKMCNSPTIHPGASANRSQPLTEIAKPRGEVPGSRGLGIFSICLQ